MMSSETIERPEWLDEKLFEPIIEKELNLDKSKFELNIILVKPAVAEGENYISMVYRVQLEVIVTDQDITKTYSFIIKSSLKALKMVEELQLFEKEMIFFDDVVPKLKEFSAMEFGPKCYLTVYNSTKLIILEDLSTRGYRLQDRQQGLDIEHCKLYFKKIAEFHALTASYHNKFGDFVKPFHTPYFNLETKHFFDMSAFRSIKEFLEIFERYDELRPYHSKMLKYQEGLFDALYNSMSSKPDEFLVLNHGDSWLNNMLFRYDENDNPIDIRLIDFQVANFGTPLLDLIYFFASSTTNEIREHHFDQLLQIYHEHLSANLTKLNYSKHIPTLRELHQDFLRRGFVAVYTITTVLPIVLLDSKHAEKDMAEKMFQANDGSKSSIMFNNPLYIKAVAATFKFLDNRGLLEKM